MLEYVTLAETIAANARRHDARAAVYLLAGRLDYALGSLRKADRNYRHAAELEPLLAWSWPARAQILAAAVGVIEPMQTPVWQSLGRRFSSTLAQGGRLGPRPRHR